VLACLLPTSVFATRGEKLCWQLRILRFQLSICDFWIASEVRVPTATKPTEFAAHMWATVQSATRGIGIIDLKMKDFIVNWGAGAQERSEVMIGMNPEIKGARMFNRMRTNPRVSVNVDSTTDACLLGTTSLIGDDVYDAAGTFLGEIEEIVLDVRTGCVRYAVLALGGFLGIGRKRVAVPWRALTPDADYRRCILDVALMQLTAVPVPQNNPWLQRADLIWSKENAYLLRQQAHLGATPPKHRSTLLKLGSAEKEKTAQLNV
jgi:hypothetical protein